MSGVVGVDYAVPADWSTPEVAETDIVGAAVASGSDNAFTVELETRLWLLGDSIISERPLM